MFFPIIFIFSVLAFATQRSAGDTSFFGAIEELLPETIRETDFFHPTDFPYVARIEKFGKHRCDGSIVGVNFVLTSAHCVMDSDVFQPDSLLGYRIRVPSQFGIFQLSFKVQNIYVHFNYLERRLDNIGNLAMIRTDKNFRVSPRLKVIKIITREPLPEEIATVGGFKNEVARPNSLKLEENAELDELKFSRAKLNIFQLERCREILHIELNEDKICAGELIRKNDPCVSVGGGPLVVDGFLAGVTNWNLGCDERDRPGVYTDTFYYREWIYDIIRQFQ